MSFLFRFNGQVGLVVDSGRVKKIRVVFAMIDEDRTKMAWYLFSSLGIAKSKTELAHHVPMPPEEFGHRTFGGREISRTFKKDMGLDGLAINPKGTPALFTLGTVTSKRFYDCQIDQLTTKMKEVVSFPFGLQTWSDTVPSRNYNLHGNVIFLEAAAYSKDKFPDGPQGHSKFMITGGGL